MNLITPIEEATRPSVRKWTEEDDARIKELRAGGLSWPMINAIFGSDARKRFDRIKLTSEEKEARKKIARDVNVTWTVEQVELLKKLYFEGLSYALISPHIGISKSGCISKVKRLRLPPREVTQTIPCASRQKGSSRKNYAKLRIARANANSGQLRLFETVQTDFGMLRCVEVPSLDLTIDQLTETTCRFIAGDACAEGGALYCGNTIFKRSYCEQHYHLCCTQPIPHRPVAMRRFAA